MGHHIYQLIIHQIFILIIPQFQRSNLLSGGEVGSTSGYNRYKIWGMGPDQSPVVISLSSINGHFSEMGTWPKQLHKVRLLSLCCILSAILSKQILVFHFPQSKHLKFFILSELLAVGISNMFFITLTTKQHYTLSLAIYQLPTIPIKIQSGQSISN